MKWLVTGVNGQLGYEVVNSLKEQGHSEILAVDVKEMDLTNFNKVREVIQNYKPDIIIHCGAYTAVDKAEDEKDLAYKINSEATRVIAECTKDTDAKLIYISTDYVFDGNGDTPFETTSIPKPQNTYGLSKRIGEYYIENLLDKYFTVRISWVFGKNGNNFIKTMLRLGREKESLSIVNDQIGSPTYAKDLSYLLIDIAKSDKYGVYHATNEGLCSWYDFAQEIFTLTNIKVKVNPCDSSQFKTKAVRPKNSRLSKKSLIENEFKTLPTWQDALKRYLIELEEV